MSIDCCLLPSLVIDGKGLLTGSSQGLELKSITVLSQRSTSSAMGLEKCGLFVNGNLTWQASQGDRVSVWRTDSNGTCKPKSDIRSYTYATDMMQFNALKWNGECFYFA